MNREEREQKAFSAVVGFHDLLWALVRVLIKKGVFTAAEYREQLFPGVGDREPVDRQR